MSDLQTEKSSVKTQSSEKEFPRLKKIIVQKLCIVSDLPAEKHQTKTQSSEKEFPRLKKIIVQK